MEQWQTDTSNAVMKRHETRAINYKQMGPPAEGFKSMAERSAWASRWVTDNRELLMSKIKQYHKPSPSFILTEMDFEDFLGDAIVILTEATIKAERKNTPWYGVFWFDFDKMMIGSQELHYRMPFADIENEVGGEEVMSVDAETFMVEFAERVKQERFDEIALRSAVQLMSPREKEAFGLVVEGVVDGRPMSSDKAGDVMGIDGSDVRKMIRSVEKKIQKAGRLHFQDGRVMLFPMPWGDKRRSVHKLAKRRVGLENTARAMVG